MVNIKTSLVKDMKRVAKRKWSLSKKKV